jgi:hypothetical protein
MQIDKNLKGTNFECPTFALYINILNMRTKISTNMMRISLHLFLKVQVGGCGSYETW